jgi:hypothetical protein
MEIRSHGDGSGWEYDKAYKEKDNGAGYADGRGGDAGSYGDGRGTSRGHGDGDGVYDSGSISGKGKTSNGFEEWNFKIK